jgi:hypothetical protein
MDLSEAAITDYLRNEHNWVTAYEKRLDTIINLCITNKIKPILITQPSMVGLGRDAITNISLEKLKLNNKENGKLWWTMLEKYNDGTRRKAIEKNIPLIDLALLLPKSSEYFYDVVHLTNKGAEKTGEILYDSVRLLLHN